MATDVRRYDHLMLAPPVLVCPNGCGHRALGAPTVAETGVPVGGGMATLHECPTLAGMTVPLVQEGTRAEARAVEREDYVGTEVGLQYDENGRAIMAVEVTRDDGTDRAVFAPTARAGVEV